MGFNLKREEEAGPLEPAFMTYPWALWLAPSLSLMKLLRNKMEDKTEGEPLGIRRGT